MTTFSASRLRELLQDVSLMSLGDRTEVPPALLEAQFTGLGALPLLDQLCPFWPPQVFLLPQLASQNGS